MSVVLAAAGLALSLGQTIFGGSAARKAKKEAKRLEAQRLAAIKNPYAGASVSTLGGELRAKESARGLATQTELIGRSGGRALAFLPQLSRNNSIIDQEIAADFDRQQKDIDQKKAYGETVVMQQKAGVYGQQMDGLQSQYAYGSSIGMQGIQGGLGILASGMSEGGWMEGLGRQPNDYQFAAPVAQTTGVTQPLSPIQSSF